MGQPSLGWLKVLLGRLSMVYRSHYYGYIMVIITTWFMFYCRSLLQGFGDCNYDFLFTSMIAVKFL